MAQPIDMTPYGGCRTSPSTGYIESGLDTGEYVAVDLFDGTTWSEAARLSGNVDQENTWHQEAVNIGGGYLVDDFKFRFRAKMSRSNEDANVDNVQLVATSLAAPPNLPPSFTSTPTTTATEDSPYSYNADADDPGPRRRVDVLAAP